MTEMTGSATGLPRLTPAHLSLAAVGLMWTLPFLQPYHRFPLTSFYGETLALLLGLLALALLARRGFWRAAGVPVPALWLLGLVALLALQHVLGRVAYGGQALVAGLYVVWAALLMVLGRGLREAIDLRGIVTVLAWFLAVGGSVGALLAVLQHYQISDLPQTLIFPKRTPAVYGNVAQYNHFANYSTLALASLGYLYASRRIHWIAVGAAAIPLLFVIGLSGSRSAVLFLAFLLLLAGLYLWRRGHGGRPLAGCIALFIAGFVMAQWLSSAPWLESSAGTETVSQRLAGGEGSSGATNIAHRLQLAREAWKMFLGSPVIGVGWGQFPWNDFLYRAAYGGALDTWPFNHAHNAALQLLAETGLVGTLLVGGAVLVWLNGLRRGAVDLEHWWLLALAGVLMAHSMLEHPLWFAYFLGIAALAAGLFSGSNVAVRLERVGPPLLGLLLISSALYAFAVATKYRDFERLFERGAAQPGSEEFVAAVSRAHREPLLEPYAELAIATAMGLDRDRLAEKRDLNGRVMRFAPIASVVYRQAILLALAGESAAAERDFGRAARVYPGELETALKMMTEPASTHPAELAPLIKLASNLLAQRRAAQGGR